MATVERRTRTDAAGREVVTYRVRWRDPSRRQRAKSFNRRADAERFRSTVAADLVRGEYIDPNAGRVAFEGYARTWLAAQTFDAATADM